MNIKYVKAEELKNTVKEMRNMDSKSVEAAARSVIEGFVKNDSVPGALFYALEHQNDLPYDIRVEYVYVPTYAACSIMMYAALENEELLNDDEFRNVLYCGLSGCTGRGFLGSGFDDISSFLRVMNMFAQGRVFEFVNKHSSFNKAFTQELYKAVEFLKNELCTGNVREGWTGTTYERIAKPVYSRLTGDESEFSFVFVYGTLMSDQSANHMLKDSELFGKYMLCDHAMYDLGSYPGIKEKKNERVIGEVYCISTSLIESLDRYEGEGSLYSRKKVIVQGEKDEISAYVYVYMGDTDESKPIRTMWGSDCNDEIWYACYGSNINSKRFSSYIKGGFCKANGRTYEGCRDKSLWKEERGIKFKGEVYFGNSSGSWDGKGVAFYDPEGEGTAYMKIYRIRYSQLLDLRKMEGPFKNWYGRILPMGIVHGLPVYTLTSESRRPENSPSEKYLKLITDSFGKIVGLNIADKENAVRGLKERAK